jgi:hypothetical protein
MNASAPQAATPSAMLPNYWALAQRFRFARIGLLLDTAVANP